nr:immunoglobulin heavy chain junction region [Mus musculus]MBK4189973.1 immunoglobulin heavy chain junction region [Mus musculus]
CARTLYYFDYW